MFNVDGRKSWAYVGKMEELEVELMELNIEEQRLKNRKIELENIEKEYNLGIRKGK